MRKLATLLLAGMLGPLEPISGQENAAEANVQPTALETNVTKAPSRPRRASRSRSSPEQMVIGGDLVVKEGESFDDVCVVGGNATIDGTVKDLIVILGQVRLGPSAEVRNDLRVIGGVLDQDPAAIVGGDRFILGADSAWIQASWVNWPKQWFNKALLLARPLPHQYLWSWGIAGVFLALYLLAAALFPRQVGETVAVLEAKPGAALAAGALAFALLGPLVVVLALSLIGTPFIPFVLFAVLAACFFGKVAVYHFFGVQLGRQTGLALLQKPLPALLAGALLCYLLYTVPVIGFAVWGGLMILGTGAALLAVSKQFRSGESKPAEPVPVLLGRPAGLATGPSATEPPNVLMLARVGFWSRLGATVLDAVPIALLVGGLFRAPNALLVVWVLYHVAMWAWKGTTIGGIVFGLKIVRTDGRPITIAVALVRALSAFLSAAVLLLGFFWAGWSSDKQSWHDKIAGTVVVRFPKGVSLV